MAAGVVLIASAALAVGDLATFRGIRLGVPVKDQLPECTCETVGTRKFCIKRDQTKSCWFDDIQSGQGPVYYAHVIDSYPDVKVVLVEEDGRLASIRWTFDLSIAPIVLENLTKKYGRPSRSTNTPISTIAGWKGTQQNRAWDRSDVYVEFTAPRSTIHDAFVEVTTPERHRAKTKKDVENLKRMEGDL